MDTFIETYNIYNLNVNQKYSTCPICSSKRSIKNQKQKCLIVNWDKGFATCQHCRIVIQIHGAKRAHNFFNSFRYKEDIPGSRHSIEFFNEVVFKFKNDTNNFSNFLESYFTREKIFEAERKLLIFSSSDFYTKSIAFPYINEKEQITGIKLMPYNSQGKRIKNKDGNGVVNWIHSLYKIKDWNNDFCLFGLHQIIERSDKSVHIVESEKTAFVMTIVKPEFIWLATGGLMMLNRKKLLPLKNYRIVLHPDKGNAFNIWSGLAKEFPELNIIVSRITEDNPFIDDKGDLADYYLKQ
ncbi:DUF6371 domain-containing protein [Flavobacterium aquatile]|uniref:DUF6371 domain-containing protein n=1 Tax=Flavobacterium aquatile TaxID=245 RepID=UPI000689F32F|nr:DUF6371 domain-containing protein [Flavobacterium aquatile]OXA65477.1 hypothetical protein B0A61_14855 [Flavobacterium aquatile LMG 4008 = ATCC 11947]GEC80200.1 hypothetical protein FAQ01_30700 [Flavobacterium aquatile]